MSEVDLVGLYTSLVEHVEDIDEQLAPGASGRKVLNALVKDNESIQSEVRKRFYDLVTNVNDGSAEAIAEAAVTLKQMKAVKAAVDAFIKANSSEGSELSDEAKAELLASREEPATKATKIRSVLEMMLSEEDFQALPSVPRKPTAGVKRGKRLKGYFTYVINGEDVGHLSNKDLATHLKIKGAALSAALEAANFDPSEMPAFWQLTVGTTTVVAQAADKPEDTPEEDEEDTDDNLIEDDED